MMGAQPGTRARMRLLVWGETDADIDTAIGNAGWGWAREDWEFTETERLRDPQCPIDTQDPKTVAADAGFGWAYAVYPVRDAE